MKWRLRHGCLDRAIRDLKVSRFLLSDCFRCKFDRASSRADIAAGHLVRSNRGATDCGKRCRAVLRVATTLAESAVNSLVAKRMVKSNKCGGFANGVRTAGKNGNFAIDFARVFDSQSRRCIHCSSPNRLYFAPRDPREMTGLVLMHSLDLIPPYMRFWQGFNHPPRCPAFLNPAMTEFPSQLCPVFGKTHSKV